MVDNSIDSWILAQKTLVLYRKRALIPAVKERTQLADALARYLQALGLTRRVREAPDIGRYLADRYGANGSDHGARSPDLELPATTVPSEEE